MRLNTDQLDAIQLFRDTYTDDETYINVEDVDGLIVLELVLLVPDDSGDDFLDERLEELTDSMGGYADLEDIDIDTLYKSDID